MAAFFPRTLYGGHTDQGFNPLFRFLEDFDRYSAGNQRSGPGGRIAASVQTFQPKFDVRETANAYELHGELAGITRDDVRLEFTDPQTLQVRGRIERSYTSGTRPSDVIDNGSTPAGAIESGESSAERPTSSQDHHAKVQDEADAAAEEKTGQVVESSSSPAKSKKADTAKYWVSERSIGEFSRTFTFPSRVEQDSVTANLKDGILSVVIPKTKKHEARRIEVS